jgi:hypothetical protein
MEPSMTATTANDPITELKNLLSTRIRGIKKVTNEYGFICVYTGSARAAKAVHLDLLRSRGFSSVRATENHRDGGFVVSALPKAA